MSLLPTAMGVLKSENKYLKRQIAFMNETLKLANQMIDDRDTTIQRLSEMILDMIGEALDVIEEYEWIHYRLASLDDE